LEYTFAQAREHFFGGKIVQHNAHPFDFFLKESQRLRKKLNRKRRRIAEVQFALFAVAHCFVGLHGFGDALYHRAGFRQKNATRFRFIVPPQ
jgi:hypothetical protein